MVDLLATFYREEKTPKKNTQSAPVASESRVSRKTKMVVIGAMLLLATMAAAYGAHHYGLVDLSKSAGYASNSLSHGMDYARGAYNFTASYIPTSIASPAKIGLKCGVAVVTYKLFTRLIYQHDNVSFCLIDFEKNKFFTFNA